MTNKTYYIYVKEDGSPYTSPRLGQITLMPEKPYYDKVHKARLYSQKQVTGYKEVKIVDV